MKIFDDIKYFVQRGKRGYADSDLWDVGYFLCNTIKDSIQAFINTDKMGIPLKYMEEAKKNNPDARTEDIEDMAMKAYNAKLQEIVDYFNEYLREDYPAPAYERYCNEVLDNDLIDNLDKELTQEQKDLQQAWFEELDKETAYKRDCLNKGFDLLRDNIEEMWW